MSFLIPLIKRGASASSEDNVLWNEGKVFIMDNHRLALWCWFQKMQKGKKYNLLHIDAHPDMSESALKHFNHDLWSMSLNEYRTTWQDDINMPLFRWDNYIEIFLQRYPELVGKTVSATHKVGQDKTLNEDIGAYYLQKYLEDVFGGSRYVNDLPWIVNLDLDYFFSAAPQKTMLFSHSYLESLSHSIQQGLESGIVDVVTISLSPECCGSWKKAEEVLTFFSSCRL
nr:UPF0489 family protein [Bacteriovorax sp. HI3]